MVSLGLLLILSSQSVDKAALRSTLMLPVLETYSNLTEAELRAIQAEEKLSQLQPELLKDPRNPELQFKVAELLARMGDQSGKLDYLNKVIKGLEVKPSPSSAEAEMLCRSYLVLERLEDAKKAAAQVLEANRRAFLDALILSAENPVPSVVRNPTDPSDAAIIEKWLPSGAKVIEAFEKAAAENPKDVTVAEYVSASNYDYALANTMKAVLTDQTAVNPWKDAKVKASVKKLLELRPNDPVQILTTLFIDAYSLPEYTVKKPYDFIPGATELGQIVYKLIGVLETEGQASFDQKFPYLSALKAISEGEGADALIALRIRSWLAIVMNKKESAKALAAQALEKSPKDVSLRMAYIAACNFAEDYETALSIAEELASEFKTQYYEFVAFALTAKAKDEATTRTRLTSALAKYPLSADLNLAECYYLLKSEESKDLSEAGSKLSRLAMDANSDDAPEEYRQNVTFYRAVYFGLLGDVSEAKRILDNLIKASPANDRYKKARASLGS